ncbi:Cytochrome P450 superfamily [Arabidopsis thaliana x Arabidopsis arenosa]|uniref:Cytochrome P450 superfamily n=2 Tax=Arabidopsis TaxID=3701 RepID=A0A8T2BBS8_ARASU|nr:Cytochrome P450 superfamily [Arabidopsis thaliana x Arabidopsis arenosa]KAG7584235.1 Cytochrome P450 superfamily [Arabidopsis suecica]
MESLLSQTQVIYPTTTALIITVHLLVLAYLISRWRKPLYPPGPKGLPIIGNMLMMDELTHHGLAKLAETYGGLFHLRMGFRHVFAITSPDVARQVLQVQDISFSNRPVTIAINYLTYDLADMAFAPYGPFWRQMRKVCVMKVFSRRRSESWASVRDEVNKIIRSLSSNVGNPVNVGELIFTLTRNITYRAAFGAACETEQDEFIRILQEFSKLFGAFNVADFVPFLGWFDLHGINKRLVKARNDLDGFIDEVIDEHMKKREIVNHDDEDTDMVDDLLAFYSEEENLVSENLSTNSNKNSIKLTRDNIKALVMDVMFGGTETMASGIEWALTELLRNPDELKRLQQELAEVVGLGQRVDETHLEKLTFLKCTLKETMRLHPPIPLILHEAIEDTKLQGFSVPKGSRLMINAFAIARDPKLWVEPEAFKPSRFMEPGMPDFMGTNFEFIPFGSGRRSCPGMQLGLYAMEVSVANIIHTFTWQLPDGMKPSELDMSDVMGLTAPRAKRLIAVPNRRLSCPF